MASSRMNVMQAFDPSNAFSLITSSKACCRFLPRDNSVSMILTALGGLHFPVADDVFPGIPALSRVVMNAAPRRKLRRIMSLAGDNFLKKILNLA